MYQSYQFPGMSLEEYAMRQAQNRQNNALGLLFEDLVTAGCEYYREKGIAQIRKTPEDFKVLKKERGANGKYNGRFKGQFLKNAQPDFQGTLQGGRSIVLETKTTEQEKISRNVLTPTQWDILLNHHKLGAECYVLAEVRSVPYLVPWHIWRDMDRYFKRKSMRKKELDPFEVRRGANGAVLFLDYKNQWEKEMERK